MENDVFVCPAVALYITGQKIVSLVSTATDDRWRSQWHGYGFKSNVFECFPERGIIARPRREFTQILEVHVVGTGIQHVNELFISPAQGCTPRLVKVVLYFKTMVEQKMNSWSV